MLNNQANTYLATFHAAILMTLCFAGNVHCCENLVFADAWIREPPPVARVAAGYVSITNPSHRDYVLDRIESDCCSHIMAHETVVEDTKIKMRHLSKIAIAAKQTVKLQPLGKHLMLVKPTHALIDGERIKIRFSCGQDDISEVMFTVSKQ